MPMMPHYQPNPYMEPPGFVMPHTHLHLMDYRRMLNPQYYQTMAYHTRRFRYQHNAPNREVTSSEVQTEPLSSSQRTSTPGSNTAEASGVPRIRSDKDTSSVPASQPLSPALAVQMRDHSPEHKDTVPPCTKRTPPNGSFVIQTEEVRIECCTTPVGLQLLHSHETAEVSHRYSQDLVQCSSIVQGRVLQEDGLCLPADQSEQALQACPDILLVTPGSSERSSELEESKSHTDTQTVSNTEVAPYGEDETSAKDLGMTFPFKVVHLPFDPKYLEELQKMESTVWSMEETLLPSADSLIHHIHAEFHDETMLAAAEEPSTDAFMLREEAPTEAAVPTFEMPPLAVDDLEHLVPTVEGPGEEMVSEAHICLMMDAPVTDDAPASEPEQQAEVTLSSNLLLLDDSPPCANQHGEEKNVQSNQDTSFESLPAYLPSTSWVADFDHLCYYNKMPPTPRKQNNPGSKCGLDVPTRRRKLDVEYKEQPAVRKPKERYKPKGKVDRRSVSDHECCLGRKFNENAFTPYASKRDRLCTRCLAKPRIYTSANPGLTAQISNRKAVPFQQWNDPLLPTCEACKDHSKKQLMRKGSVPDVRGPHPGHDTEGESSENSARRKWRTAEDPRKLNDLKRPLASKQNLDKCPAGLYPKLREKNCVCNEPQHQPVAWERLRHCPHGNAIREKDENCAKPFSPQDRWRNMDQIYLTQRWQTGKQMRVTLY